MGVAVPGKADDLKHPIVLRGKCSEHFETYLTRAQESSSNWYYSSWAYVSGSRGYACAWGADDAQAVERCNSYKKGTCKVYAKSPVNGKIGIVWKEDENRHTSPKITAKKTHASSSDKETSSLEKIKDKCTELGFTKGTEKHGDCVMKLFK